MTCSPQGRNIKESFYYSQLELIDSYQGAQGLASQVQGMLSQAKSVIPANATSTTKVQTAKLTSDLSQLKSSIDAKDANDKVAIGI